MKEPDFIVHDEKDNVGVIVVETVQAGKSLNGWVMANDKSLTLVSGNDIPIGHKIALKDLSEGDTAVKYGEDIGRITAAVAVGGHVHTQNLKTKRW